MKTATLYRPVGIKEMELILEADSKSYPPRLPEQPIFYPVLNFEYAEQIARDWNATGPEGAGFVTRCEVEAAYVSRFEEQVVGNKMHRELWVPADELEEFNKHIVEPIRLIAAYYGSAFKGYVPKSFGLKGRSADEQFVALHSTVDDYPMDFWCEVGANRIAVQLNFAYWAGRDFSTLGIESDRKRKVLGEIVKCWESKFPGRDLVGAEKRGSP
jgi:hypothetical protein